VFDPVRSLFDVGPEVDVQMCCRPVVVVQTRRRCPGVVVLLFSVLLFGVLFDYTELPGLSPVRRAQYETAVATEGLCSIYTISDGRGLGLQCRRQCRKRRSLPVRGTVGNWIQPVFLAYVGGARQLQTVGNRTVTRT